MPFVTIPTRIIDEYGQDTAVDAYCLHIGGLDVEQIASEVGLDVGEAKEILIGIETRTEDEPALQYSYPDEVPTPHEIAEECRTVRQRHMVSMMDSKTRPNTGDGTPKEAPTHGRRGRQGAWIP